jgi:hypothetical protein
MRRSTPGRHDARADRPDPVNRGREHAVTDRDELHRVLAEALVAHVGVVMGEHPVVLPAAFAVDADGPDRDGTLYVQGSVAAAWLRGGRDATVYVTVTLLDALVTARSATLRAHPAPAGRLRGGVRRRPGGSRPGRRTASRGRPRRSGRRSIGCGA